MNVVWLFFLIFLNYQLTIYVASCKFSEQIPGPILPILYIIASIYTQQRTNDMTHYVYVPYLSYSTLLQAPCAPLVWLAILFFER